MKRNFYIIQNILIAAVIIFAQSVKVHSQNFVPYQVDGKWGYQDDAKRIVIEPNFFHADEFSPENIAGVVDNYGWAIINQAGYVLLRPFVADNKPDIFRDENARFVYNQKFGFFDKYGRVVIAPIFDYASYFSDGMAAICFGCIMKQSGDQSVLSDGRWGYINNKAEVIISPMYESAGNFNDGKAQVKFHGQWLYIDKNGKAVRD